MAAAPNARMSLGLVSLGHFCSHFFMLSLAPLFPLMQPEFGVNYTALGAIITVFSVASGAGQFPMGLLVDRVGARHILTGGLMLLAGSIALMSITTSYTAVLVLAFLAGLGNSVFHPADYAILGANVSAQRMGRAFSLHTFAGHFGFAAAPISIIFLTTLTDWRTALGIVGLFGLAAAAIFIFKRQHLTVPRRAAHVPTAAQPKPVSNWGLLLSAPVLLLFLFYTMTGGITTGLSGFLPTAVSHLHGIDLIGSSAMVTGLLASSATGVLVGGFVADRFRRFDLIAGVGYTCSALSLCVIALVPLPVPGMVAVFCLTGFMVGIITPSRDLLVRGVTPPGKTGAVFGFVSTGLDVGGALAPLLFGMLIDYGMPIGIFIAAAGFMMLSMTAGIAVTRMRKPAVAAAAE